MLFRSGVIENEAVFDESKLAAFTTAISDMKREGLWRRSDLIELFNLMIPGFCHKETGKYLDGRM